MRRVAWPPRIDGSRLRGVAIAFAAVALPASLVLTLVVLDGSIARQSRAAVDAGRAAAVALDHELQLREQAVSSIVANAEQLLDGKLGTTVEVVEHLAPVPARGGYAMAVPPGYRATDVGSLMGEGPIPARGSEAAAELAMAFALSSSFQVLQASKLDIPWAYYLSRRGFLYIYPRVAAGQFLWSHELLDRYDGKPGGAPLRVDGPRQFWSALYLDKAGKGRMTTLSKLVVHGGAIAGDVSIDVGVATLVAQLDSYRRDGSYMHLLAPDGADMLGRRAPPAPLDVRTTPVGVPVRVGDAEVVQFEVPTTGWRVAVETPRRVMFLRALRESSVYGLLVLFMLASLALLAVLARALRGLAAMSVRDPLTGLYNRRHFEDVARAEVAKARRVGLVLGLVLVDVDHFKKYNDRYGHPAGDRALRAVADALRGSLQRASDMLFRVGGEEFAVVVYVDRLDQVRMLSDKLCAAVRRLELPHAASPAGHVTISVGATTVEAPTRTDLDAAYAVADAALYRAKHAGRDRVELG